MIQILTNQLNKFNLYQSTNGYETICIIRILVADLQN